MFYYTSVHLRRRLSTHRRTWLFGYHPPKQARRRAAKRMLDLKKQGNLNASEHCRCRVQTAGSNTWPDERTDNVLSRIAPWLFQNSAKRVPRERPAFHNVALP